MAESSRTGSRDAPPARAAASAGRAAEPARAAGELANFAVAQHVRGGGNTTDLPGAPLDNQQQNRARGSLPHRAAMERSFGRSLGHLDVQTGAGEIAAFGAQALATGNRIAFRDASPPPSIVAHEVTHALQSERGGGGGGLVAPRGSAAETEADAFASLIAQRGAGARLPRPSARPAGQVHLAPPTFGPMQPLPGQDDLLRQWIMADTAKAPKFNPSLSQFDQPPIFRTASPANKGGTFDPAMGAEVAKWVKGLDAPSDASAAPVGGQPAPTTGSAASKFPGWDASSFPPSGFPMTGFPSNSAKDPHSHDYDPFAPKNDPFKPKYDPNVCNVGCHGVQYQRMAPPAPAWSAPDAATGAAAVKKESQSTEDTAAQIDLQVLAAKASAIGAAAAAGKLPADLQSLWQEATLSAESLRTVSPALARTKPSDPLPPPPKPATPPPPGTTPTAPDVDASAAEAARTAIDAFYWSLVDVLQVKEAEALSSVNLHNQLGALQASKPQQLCPGSCHQPAGDPNKFVPLPPPVKISPLVVTREKALTTATTVDQWKTALSDFDATSMVQLEELLKAILPPDSKELKQLTLATDLRDRVAALQNDGTKAIRIPAVFYPENDLATETGADGKSVSKANGYSWYLFLHQQADGIWVLRDLTSNRVFTNTAGGDLTSNIESFAVSREPASDATKYPIGVLTELMNKLDSELHMPKGQLFYTLPGGRAGTVTTTASWDLSDWLRAIGLTLAAIGLVALTAGAGTPAALAFVGAGLIGAAATKAQLEEMEAQGIATDSERARAYVTMAIDLIGALAGGLGMIARAPSMFGQLALMADRVYVPVRAAALGGDVVQAALMTHDFVSNLQALVAQPDSKERSAGIVKLIAMGLAMGALSYVSIKGGIHELTSGARPRVAANDDGSFSLVGKGGVSVPEGSGGWNAKWKATVGETVEDPSLGKSVVVEVERDANGLVVSARPRKGPNASQTDVDLHVRVADMVASYGGAQGRIRNLWRETLAKFGIRRPPIEVELEIWKLEQSAKLRMNALSEPGVTEADRLVAKRELDVIEHNLEVARQNARKALLAPPQTPAQRAQIWMKEQPEGLPSAPEGTQWVRTEAGKWDLLETGVRPGGAEIRAVYDVNGEVIGISNRAQVGRARVVGRTVGEVQERLEGIGYTVETVDVGGVPMRRLKPTRPNMVELEVDSTTGVVQGPTAGSEKWVPPKSWNGPSEHGRWVGGKTLKGNTGWIDDRPEVIRVVGRAPNGEANPIAFDHGRVDFGKYSQGEIEVAGLTGKHKTDMPLIRDAIADKYGLAIGQSKTARRQAAIDWMAAQPDGYGGFGLAPHHAGGNTVQYIPVAVHDVQHTNVFKY